MPRPYEDITVPRGAQPGQVSSRAGTMPTRSEETAIPDQSRWGEEQDHPAPTRNFTEDGYEADDDAVRRRAPRGSQEQLEMRDMSPYAELEGSRPSPPAYGSSREPLVQSREPLVQSREPVAQTEPTYATVDKSKKTLKLQDDGEAVGDSWV